MNHTRKAFCVAVENRAEQAEGNAGSNLVCVNVHFMAIDFSAVAVSKLAKKTLVRESYMLY